jgi:hypothetical protein
MASSACMTEILETSVIDEFFVGFPIHSIIRKHGVSIATVFAIRQQPIIDNIGPILQLYYGGAKCTSNVNGYIAQSLQHCKDQYFENLLQYIGQLTSEIHCLQHDIIRLKDHNLALKIEVTQLRIEIQLTRSMTSDGLSIATDDHQQDLEPDALHVQAEIEMQQKEIASLREAPGSCSN